MNLELKYFQNFIQESEVSRLMADYELKEMVMQAEYDRNSFNISNTSIASTLSSETELEPNFNRTSSKFNREH